MDSFLRSFKFYRYDFENYKFTDNGSGIQAHYIAKMLCGNAKIVESNGNFIEIAQGDYFYLPKGLRYCSYWYGKPKISFYSFGFTQMPIDDNEYIPLQKITPSDNFIGQFDKIELGFPSSVKNIGNFYLLVNELLKIAVRMPKNGSSRLVLKAEELLRNNPYLSVPELANELKVSESTVYANFKESSLLSPTELKQKILCERATAMLAATDLSVEEISYRLGFSSSSYFRKVFKRHMNTSPRMIRKNATI